MLDCEVKIDFKILASRMPRRLITLTMHHFSLAKLFDLEPRMRLMNTQLVPTLFATSVLLVFNNTIDNQKLPEHICFVCLANGLPPCLRPYE